MMSVMAQRGPDMSSDSIKDTVIWCVVAVAAVSSVFGMLFIVAIQKLMAGERTFMGIVLLLLPLSIVAVVVNVRRILKAVR
jgi:hypothetical protein